MRRIAFLAAALAAPAVAQDGPPPDFFAGSYQIYGQAPDGGAPYAGAAQIAVDGAAMRVERQTLNDTTVETARMERHDVVETRVLYFYDADDRRTAMCLWSVDLGNYAILNCVRRGRSDDAAPGLETFVSAR